MKKIILIFLSMIIIIGCGTLDTSLTENNEIRLTLDPLALSMDTDIYQLRVDLLRNTMTADANGKTSENAETIKSPYHSIGLRLGNGIFLDYNMNLTVDLIEYYNLDKEKLTLKRIEQTGIGKKTFLFEKDSDRMQITENTMIPRKSRIYVEENEIKITGGLFFTSLKITEKENLIKAVASGVVNVPQSGMIVKDSETEYRFPGLDNLIVDKISDNIINISDILNVNQFLHSIRLQNTGLTKNEGVYTFIKIENGFVFFNDTNEGIYAIKKDNTIFVYKNDSLDFKVEIID